MAAMRTDSYSSAYLMAISVRRAKLALSVVPFPDTARYLAVIELLFAELKVLGSARMTDMLRFRVTDWQLSASTAATPFTSTDIPAPKLALTCPWQPKSSRYSPSGSPVNSGPTVARSVYVVETVDSPVAIMG